MTDDKAAKIRQIVRDAYNDDVYVADDAVPEEIGCEDTPGQNIGYWLKCELWVSEEELGEPHNKVA